MKDRTTAIQVIAQMLREDPLRSHTGMTAEQLDLDAGIFARQIVDAYEALPEVPRRYPQWKIDAWNNRNAGRCTCPPHIPGCEAEKWSESCAVHGPAIRAKRDDAAEAEGRSIVENENDGTQVRR